MLKGLLGPVVCSLPVPSVVVCIILPSPHALPSCTTHIHMHTRSDPTTQAMSYQCAFFGVKKHRRVHGCVATSSPARAADRFATRSAASSALALPLVIRKKSSQYVAAM